MLILTLLGFLELYPQFDLLVKLSCDAVLDRAHCPAKKWVGVSAVAIENGHL